MYVRWVEHRLKIELYECHLNLCQTMTEALLLWQRRTSDDIYTQTLSTRCDNN